ncbi:MAG: TetR/AcrR family transcriptional regulator [Actinomycetia bacterium]|nr:TetR/AcrR family transcriptional regulator [Actinomycetes bacterium]
MATRDAAATQRRILQAARREFAAKGISGARVDAIAARARTNKRMIYYYFGSKDGLFREVLRQQLASRAAQQPETDADTGTWGDRIARRQAMTLGINDYVRLLMWEALETTSSSRKKPLIAQEERMALFAELRGHVEAAQADGSLRPDLDAGQMLLTELALTMFPVAFPQIVRMATGMEVDDPEFLATRQQFLIELANGFAAP